MLENLWLVHPHEEMCESFRRRFAGLPGVRVIQGRFENLEPHDCFVTAGNAFGIMTAGIDAAVIHRLGEPLMERVQFKIMNEYFGEQPVGTAFVIETGSAEIPFLCHAPTMRVPGPINGTDKVYSATWAALLAIQAHNQSSSQKIFTAAMPAMGAGFGGVPHDEAARQMSVAYRHFCDPPHRLDWDFVARRQLAICYDGKQQVVK
ncbi:macro domain-containing protein [Anatilimnocola sp. NA78]|uniref:macro domain-containing protein n=1 Tax=Anatilimnocola sp. NA78 TaxID=3415683 RepID=UPI003CE4C8C4